MRDIVRVFLETARRERLKDPGITVQKIAAIAKVPYQKYLTQLALRVVDGQQDIIDEYKSIFGRLPVGATSVGDEDEPEQGGGDHLDATYNIVRILEAFSTKTRALILQSARLLADINPDV